MALTRYLLLHSFGFQLFVLCQGNVAGVEEPECKCVCERHEEHRLPSKMTIEWGTTKFDNGSNEQVLSGQERATFFHIMLPALAIFFVIAFVFYFVHGFTTYDRVRNIRDVVPTTLVRDFSTEGNMNQGESSSTNLQTKPTNGNCVLSNF